MSVRRPSFFLVLALILALDLALMTIYSSHADAGRPSPGPGTITVTVHIGTDVRKNAPNNERNIRSNGIGIHPSQHGEDQGGLLQGSYSWESMSRRLLKVTGDGQQIRTGPVCLGLSPTLFSDSAFRYTRQKMRRVRGSLVSFGGGE